MNISYYMPFKPLGHRNPSGDLITGAGIYNYLKKQGHSVELASSIRCRWIYYRPDTLLRLLLDRSRIVRSTKNQKHKPDLWLSYHTYYKAPDLLGPTCSQKLGIPYVIFQGIYSTKRRKKIKTLPGFVLNKKALISADHVITNKKKDFKNLKRIIAEDKLTYIAPTVQAELFEFKATLREQTRKQLGIEDETVVMTAAMMRPGVKTEGLATVIESCRKLSQNGYNLTLLIAGDGKCRNTLEKIALEALPLKVKFLGKIERVDLHRYYSSADIFAFPGVDESLGMVYLEAQANQLPAVAYSDWGGGEAIIHQQTGLISPATEPERFTRNIEQLITNQDFRRTLGTAASKHIRHNHDTDRNYEYLEKILQQVSWGSS